MFLGLGSVSDNLPDPGAGVPELPLNVIIDIHCGKCPSRDPTMKVRDDAIIVELKLPQHEMATQIGTKTVPAVPSVNVAMSVATAEEVITSRGVKMAR